VNLPRISHCVLLTHVGIPSHVCRFLWDFPAIDVGPSRISDYILLIYMEIPCHVR
ncbi:hypothetical protein PAXRUDRAFT_158638, partial [Paxillus rubicundulus Ve08.2h10]